MGSTPTECCSPACVFSSQTCFRPGSMYAPLREIFGIVALDRRAWAVMIPVVAASSLTGIYLTRWILKRVPLWGN